MNERYFKVVVRDDDDEEEVKSSSQQLSTEQKLEKAAEKKADETEKEEKPEDIKLASLKITETSVPIRIVADKVMFPEELYDSLSLQVRTVIKKNSQYAKKISSEEDYESSKEERAVLNKCNKNINDFRKNVTKYTMNGFVNQCNMLCNELNKSIVLHDEFINHYDKTESGEASGSPVAGKYKLVVKSRSLEILDKVRKYAKQLGAEVSDLESKPSNDGTVKDEEDDPILMQIEEDLESGD